MNKYQEALQVMKSNNERIVDKARIFVDKYVENPFVVLQELVDKENPKKVVEELALFRCPKCNEKLLIYKYSINYCYECGQKLEWEE